MQTFGGLGLLAALVICYMLYFRSQTPPPNDAASDEGRPIAVAPALSGSSDLRKVAAPHTVYKADLDRAHAAARQIQDAHAEANSY